MFLNFFKIAWRNLLRNKSYSFINLFGLSIGLACCLMILLWVGDELSYDKWNEKADRTYRVAAEINFGGAHRHMATTPAPLADALRRDFPEVENVARFRWFGSSLVKDVQSYKEENMIYADSSIFQVFSFQMLKGDPVNALVPPNTVVITEPIADKYFGDENPIGQTLTVNDTRKLTVTGVIKDIPSNSHFDFDFLVSMTDLRGANDGIWVSHNFHTYYTLNEDADPSAFEEKVFPFLLEKYIAPQVQTLVGMSYEELTKAGTFIKYDYQPLTDIHLKSDVEFELGPNGRAEYVRIFLAAAIFILLIACVNFMNLATAQSSMRAKEIGVRKVLGSMRKNLIYQFLSESYLLVGLALIIGLIMAAVAMPFYNNLAGKELSMPLSSPVFWISLVLGSLFVGLIAGSYPAFYLSGFKPIQSLYGRIMNKTGNISLRNALVIFQFFIAVILIEGTIIIRQQMNFVQTTNLGFERDQVLVVQDAYALDQNLRAFKEEVLRNPRVNQATISSYLPVPSARSDSPLCTSAEFREDNCVSIQMWDVDDDYIPTMGIKMKDGRNFLENMPTDSSAVIINEKAAQLFGFEDPVGKLVYGSRGLPEDGGGLNQAFKIVGVVEDFHFESLRQNIGALSLFLSPSTGYISLKIQADQARQVISGVQNVWETMAPGKPFTYQFLDDSFNRMYESEVRVGKIFSIFSGLSIFIACLGLLGLAAFATERRTKEIGIRKVLGASTLRIVNLLTKDFMFLVLIALVVASPIAWYFMDQWLADFAYRTQIEWWVFALTAVLSIMIASATVSFQSIKAALKNPVNSLRTE